jgi:hypothetical protein
LWPRRVRRVRACAASEPALRPALASEPGPSLSARLGGGVTVRAGVDASLAVTVHRQSMEVVTVPSAACARSATTAADLPTPNSKLEAVRWRAERFAPLRLGTIYPTWRLDRVIRPGPDKLKRAYSHELFGARP